MKPSSNSLLHKTDPSQPAKPQLSRTERECFYCNKKGRVSIEEGNSDEATTEGSQCRAEPKKQSASAVQKRPSEIRVNKGGFQSTPMVFSSWENSTTGITKGNITMDESYVGAQKITVL